MKRSWAWVFVFSTLPFGAAAGDAPCQALIKALPLHQGRPMPGIQSWSHLKIEELLAEPLLPPLSDEAQRTLLERYADGDPSFRNTIEIGKTSQGSIGIFETVGRAGTCATGRVLVEQDGRLTLGAEIDESNASCGTASIQLVATDDGAVPVMIDASGGTDGNKSLELYEVLSTTLPATPESTITCEVLVTYSDQIDLTWPPAAPFRNILLPVVGAVMRAGDISGGRVELAQAFAPVTASLPAVPIQPALQRLLYGDRLVRGIGDGDWAAGSATPDLDHFDAVARLVVLDGENYVLAVGRDGSGFRESPPTFRLLGWRQDGYVLVVEGVADVKSTFDHVEIVSDEDRD